MTEMICNAIGASVMVGAGIGLAGLCVELACNYAWRKLQDAYSLAQVARIVRKYGVELEKKS